MVVGSVPEEVDLVVIGGGVGGYFAAIRAAQLGLSVTLVEKEKLGGHCLNYACIPSKTLIHIADLFYDAKHSDKFGINTGSISLDARKMLQWRMDTSKKLEDGVGFLCKKNEIEVIKGSARFISSNQLSVSNGAVITFKKAIIATGSEPTQLDILPFGTDILDYKRALMLDSIPATMLIVGGGYVAVELGTLYAKLGSKVTIATRSDLLSHFDADAVSLIKKRMTELGVQIVSGAVPASRNGNSVKFDSGAEVAAEIIVVAVGLSPYTKELGLENTKVELDEKGFIKTDNRMVTSDEDILAIGDVTAGPLLAHRAMRQGMVAGEVSAGKNSAYDNLTVPSAIFSDPEIAMVGNLEEKEGVIITKFPLSALGIAIAVDHTNGFIKMAYDENKIIKGIEIVGPNAANIISEGALAIEMGATLEDIADTIHVHPTFSELFKEVSDGGLGRGIDFFYGKS